MRCPQCSTETPEDANFCPACGHNFTSVPPPKNPTATSPPSASGDTAGDTAGDAKDPVSFSLNEDDFGRALRRAAKAAGVGVPPGLVVNDPISLQQAGEQIGLDLSLIHISEPTRPY